MATRSEVLGAPLIRSGWLERARSRPGLLFAGSVVALFVVLILGIGLGSVAVAPADTIAILAHRLLGLELGRSWSTAAETIVVDLRLPRVLSAMVVGLGLAVAGATFQGLLRNPLADPYVLGTASGAALGAAIARPGAGPRRHPRVRPGPAPGVRRRDPGRRGRLPLSAGSAASPR